MCFIYRTHHPKSPAAIHPIPPLPMAAERAGQLIINILDFKYIFSKPETHGKCPQWQEGLLNINSCDVYSVCVCVLPILKEMKEMKEMKDLRSPAPSKI